MRGKGWFLLLGSSFLACSPGYVLRAAWEEARILTRRQSMEEVLNDPTLDDETRGKLELVIEARSFAARDLGLDVGDSYTSYADIGRDTLALVLSASPLDRLAAYTWWFPIVGRVPYKGFFNREAAEKERRKLEEQRYDTYLRTTSAFSTLGWLPDPLLNTVLRQDSVGLVETVIHEVTHNTFFLSGQVKFNESFANFVGSVGAIEFFCERDRDGSLCRTARDRWNDTVRLSAFLDELWDALEMLYDQQLPVDSVLPHRQRLLARQAERYRQEYAPAMKTPGFATYDPGQLNNASLVARHLYYHRLPLFQAIYEGTGDLERSFRLIAGAVEQAEAGAGAGARAGAGAGAGAGATDPWNALQRLAERQAAP